MNITKWQLRFMRWLHLWPQAQPLPPIAALVMKPPQPNPYLGMLPDRLVVVRHPSILDGLPDPLLCRVVSINHRHNRVTAALLIGEVMNGWKRDDYIGFKPEYFTRASVELVRSMNMDSGGTAVPTLKQLDLIDDGLAAMLHDGCQLVFSDLNEIAAGEESEILARYGTYRGWDMVHGTLNRVFDWEDGAHG